MVTTGEQAHFESDTENWFRSNVRCKSVGGEVGADFKAPVPPRSATPASRGNSCLKSQHDALRPRSDETLMRGRATGLEKKEELTWLRPHCDEGRVSHFRLETGKQNPEIIDQREQKMER